MSTRHRDGLSITPLWRFHLQSAAVRPGQHSAGWADAWRATARLRRRDVRRCHGFDGRRGAYFKVLVASSSPRVNYIRPVVALL